MQYKLNKIELLSAVGSMFEQSDAIVLNFQDDCICFLSMLSDGAMGLYACVKSPNITRQEVKNFKDQKRVFFTKELRQGILICQKASKDVSQFFIKVVPDGVILCSKQNKLTVNETKIKCIDEEIPNYDDLVDDFGRLDDFLCLHVAAKHLSEGLSGIDSKIEDVALTIAPCKKQITRGNLLLQYRKDGIEIKHFVRLPIKTTSELATVNYEGTWAGVGLCILKKIMDKFPMIYSKSIGREDNDEDETKQEEHKTKKRKTNKKEEDEEEEIVQEYNDKIQIVLRLLPDENTSLGIFYNLNGVIVKLYISPKQDNQTLE